MLAHSTPRITRRCKGTGFNANIQIYAEKYYYPNGIFTEKEAANT